MLKDGGKMVVESAVISVRLDDFHRYTQFFTVYRQSESIIAQILSLITVFRRLSIIFDRLHTLCQV